MSNNFRYEPFVVVSGNRGGKVPVVDDVLSSHEKNLSYYLTRWKLHSLNVKQIGTITLIWDRRIWLLKLKFVNGRGYETYNSEEVKKEHKEDAKADEETEEGPDAPVPLVTHLENILHSVFSTVEVYINNQQTYNSKGLYAHKSYISNNFKEAISEYKRVLHCDG